MRQVGRTHILSPGSDDGDDGKRHFAVCHQTRRALPVRSADGHGTVGDDVTLTVGAQRPTRQQHKDTQPVSGKVTDIRACTPVTSLGWGPRF